jgi:hypothetical protein
MVTGLSRFKARLPRWWGKVDIDLWRRHGIGLADIGPNALVDSWKWLLPLVDIHALLVELIVGDAKVAVAKLGQGLLLWHQSRRYVRTVCRAMGVIEIELSELHNGILEEGRVLLRVKEGRDIQKKISPSPSPQSSLTQVSQRWNPRIIDKNCHPYL